MNAVCCARNEQNCRQAQQKGGCAIANQGRVAPGRVVDKTRVNNQIHMIKAKEIRVVAEEGQSA